tara:strand:+ start:2409 stop:2663 length:255 start_codon:yes stop_codon:yes gene_type:complete
VAGISADGIWVDASLLTFALMTSSSLSGGAVKRDPLSPVRGSGGARGLDAPKAACPRYQPTRLPDDTMPTKSNAHQIEYPRTPA